MTYPEKPSGNYSLRDYNFGENDNKKIPMNEYLFKNGYRNANESDTESVPDAHNENWFYDMIHRNLRYTQQVAEENKNQLENKVASYTSIGQVKIGYGLQVTSNGVLSVIKEVAENANVISYDLPVGSYMLWAGTDKVPEYFIEPNGDPISREQYPELWEFAKSNNLVADGNEYVSGKLFGIGDGETTFVPFDIRGKFLKIANDDISVGTYEEAGLPDHNHTFEMKKTGKSGSDTKTVWSYSEGVNETLTSDLASNSNKIYGNSDTVTPENYALRLIMKALPTPPSNAVPTGTILDYTGKEAPIGYIIANGAELSRTTFSTLFNWALKNNLFIEQSKIPNTAHGLYGTGDGSTTFTIPDLRGVCKRGVDLSSDIKLGEYLNIGGEAGFPDFNNAINISSGYTATQNGFIFLMAKPDGDSSVSINNFKVTFSHDDGDGQSAGSTFMPVKKGDVITFTRTNNAKFIPVCSDTYGTSKSVIVNYIIKY